MSGVLLMLSWFLHVLSVSNAPPAPVRLSLVSDAPPAPVRLSLVSDAPPAPVGLNLTSVNFRHELQWEHGAGSSPGVTYSVCLHTDSVSRGRCCAVVPGCERVVEPLLCDLTEACMDPEETYHLRVTAQHPVQISEHPQPRQEHSCLVEEHPGPPRASSSRDNFYPIRDTVLQPPVLHVALYNSSLCVDMVSPDPQLHHLYDKFVYELKVESTASRRATVKKVQSLRRTVFPNISGVSQFCVSIRFADPFVPRESGFGPTECTSDHTPSATDHTPISMVLPLVFLLVLLVPLLVWARSTLLQKPALPSVLTAVLHSEQKLEVSCHPAVSSLLLIDPAPPVEQMEYCSLEEDLSEEEVHLSEQEAHLSEQEAQHSVEAGLYRSKASLCSNSDCTASMEASTIRGFLKEEPEEEVNLCTLTFRRDTDMNAGLLWDLEPEEELPGPEGELQEDSAQTGYMTRPSCF